MGGMKDLFGDTLYPRDPHQITRRDNPSTSFAAAIGVVPKLGKFQKMVLTVLKDAGPNGLTDAELNRLCTERFGKRAESTYRKRRGELVECGLVLETGRERLIDGQKRKVWMAR